MLTLDDLTSGDYHTVVVATPDAQGRPVGRHLPLRRFLADPEAGVEVSAYALVYDLAGVPVEGATFAGFHTGLHDVHLRPDLATLRPYPGVPGTAVCLADVADAAGEPVAVAPRTILRRPVAAARASGYAARLATELEFYLFRDDPGEARRRGFHGQEPTTAGRSAYGVAAAVAQEPFLRPLREAMEAAGIPVAAAQAEVGPGQWEVNLEHADPLEAADRHLLFKAGSRSWRAGRG